MPAIVDAGPLVAWAISRDPDHSRALTAIASQFESPIVPALPLAEASYLVQRNAGARIEALFVRNLTAFEVVAPTAADLHRMAELMEQYVDWPLGAADASIVALAERLRIDTIITFDRRHFGAIRPRHIAAFKVLPD